MLAIMLCVALIFSFSLSIYAVQAAGTLHVWNEELGGYACNAVVSTIDYSRFNFRSSTNPVGDVNYISFVYVYLVAYDGDDNFDFDMVEREINATSMDAAIANVSCTTAADYATSNHFMEDIYGCYAETTTGIEY